MKEKEMEKIVTYEFLENEGTDQEREVEQACIFYSDGSVESITLGYNKYEKKEITLPDNSKQVFDAFVKSEPFLDQQAYLKECQEKLMKKKGIADIEEANELGIIISDGMDGETFEQEFQNYRNSANKNKQLPAVTKVAKEPEKEKKVKKTPWYRKYLKKAVAAICGFLAFAMATVGITGFGFFKKKDNNVNKAKSKTEQDVKKIAEEADYAQMTFEELLDVTDDKFEEKVQGAIWDYLNYINEDIAEKHLEEGKTSRIAHTYDEAIVKWLVYNADQLTKDQITRIFDMYQLDAEKLKETFDVSNMEDLLIYTVSEEAIDQSMLFLTEDGKEFDAKYSEMVAAIRRAEGITAKQKMAEKFYKELRKDFPQMNAENREVGTIHEDRSVESYKLSIIPKLAAVEAICQNYNIDYTLTDKEIAYFNDSGLCNQAYASLEKIAGIMDSYQVAMEALNETVDGPQFEHFKNAAEKELKERGIYNIDDRDISDHDEFQEQVNWHFDDYTNSDRAIGGIKYTTKKVVKTHTTTKTHTDESEKELSRNKALKTFGEREVEKQRRAGEKRAVDAKNKKNKAAGEAKAEQNRQQMQKEENENKEKLDKEVADSDKDLQDNLDKVNDKMDNNQPATEDDIGHGAEIDDDKKDENGNLGNWTEDYTTDSSNSSNDPLPDPNDYANDNASANKKDYNIKEKEKAAPKTPSPSKEPAKTKTETVKTSESSQTKSVEKLAEEAVERMANEPDETAGKGPVLTK